MSAKEKMDNAKPSTWVIDGLTQEEVKQIVEDAREQAKHDLSEKESK